MEVRRGVAGPRPSSVPAAPGELERAGSCGPAQPEAYPGQGRTGSRLPQQAQAHPNPRPCGRSSKWLKKEKIRKKEKEQQKKPSSVATIALSPHAPSPIQPVAGATRSSQLPPSPRLQFSPGSPRSSGGKALRKCATTVVNVLKMAAAAAEGGGRGSGGGRQCGEGGHRSGDRPTGFRPGPEAETPRDPSPTAHTGPPAPLALPHPAPAASGFGRRAPKPPLRTRNNRLQLPRRPHGLAPLGPRPAASSPGPQPLTSSIPPVA